MLQFLSKTIGIDSDSVILLDALRKQRNIADYSGDLVTDAAVADCISQAKELQVLTRLWLKQPASG